MWGPGPWMGPVWGFWWIFPLIGLLICLFFVTTMIRRIAGGGRFMCMGPHQDNCETDQLRREIEDLRERLKKQEAAR